MNIFLVILIILTVVSLILKKKIAIIITCSLVLFAQIDREVSIGERVRNNVFLKEAQIDEPEENIGFSKGAFAVAIYTQETRFYLYICSLLILLLQVGSLYGKPPKKKLPSRRGHRRGQQKEEELAELKKGDDRKKVIAWLIRKKSTVNIEWITTHLKMGSTSNFARHIRAVENTKEGFLWELKNKMTN